MASHEERGDLTVTIASNGAGLGRRFEIGAADVYEPITIRSPFDARWLADRLTRWAGEEQARVVRAALAAAKRDPS